MADIGDKALADTEEAMGDAWYRASDFRKASEAYTATRKRIAGDRLRESQLMLKHSWLEEKLGIHGSPTAVMSYGDNGGATGFLIGAENKGMAAMFTMMNAARLNIGVQGVAIAERAFQQAYAFARERRQGKPFGLQHESTEMVPIIFHQDVRRMLWTMKALAEAGRAICISTAMAILIS